MPDGSGAVQLAQLPALADQAFRAFVRFPAGWSRSATGYYVEDEEVFVLEGDLTFNEHAWQTGSYSWIPALSPRNTLHSTNGALVFAWFSGPPRWKRGLPAVSAQKLVTSIASWQTMPRVDVDGIVNAHMLRNTDRHRAWVASEKGCAPALVAASSA